MQIYEFRLLTQPGPTADQSMKFLEQLNASRLGWANHDHFFVFGPTSHSPKIDSDRGY